MASGATLASGFTSVCPRWGCGQSLTFEQEHEDDETVQWRGQCPCCGLVFTMVHLKQPNGTEERNEDSIR